MTLPSKICLLPSRISLRWVGIKSRFPYIMAGDLYHFYLLFQFLLELASLFVSSGLIISSFKMEFYQKVHLVAEVCYFVWVNSLHPTQDVHLSFLVWLTQDVHFLYLEINPSLLIKIFINFFLSTLLYLTTFPKIPCHLRMWTSCCVLYDMIAYSSFSSASGIKHNLQSQFNISICIA